MMNNFKKLGALLLVVVTALACGDLLEENPDSGNGDFDGTRAIVSEANDNVGAENALADAVITGIDYKLVNKSTIDIAGIYIGLTGKVGARNYTFISNDLGWVRPGETTGLPYYPGLDVSIEPGTKVTDVTLEIYAYTWDDQIITINSWIQERWSIITYFNFYGHGKTVFISQEDITIPLNGDRLMLNITME
ncbi:MAG: hypothetical protein LUD76_06715 [Alistipes sp.]|nr:hypothetical protein [Alistipes sp.]